MPVDRFDALPTKLIPMWVSYCGRAPFLWINPVTDSHQSLALCSRAHFDPSSSVDSDMDTSRQSLIKDWDNPPGTLDNIF